MQQIISRVKVRKQSKVSYISAKNLESKNKANRTIHTTNTDTVDPSIL